MIEACVFAVRRANEQHLQRVVDNKSKPLAQPCKTHIRKEFRVYFAVEIQVSIITCMTKEHDQKDVVEVLVRPAV
jgi:hypothetical protein